MPLDGGVFPERKDLQFAKCMVQSRNLGEGSAFCFRVESGLTHIFDPCWMWVGRLAKERNYAAMPADGSKTGSEKPSENLVCATYGKVNPKWS